jgi:hypothetical protein
MNAPYPRSPSTRRPAYHSSRRPNGETFSLNVGGFLPPDRTFPSPNHRRTDRAMTRASLQRGSAPRGERRRCQRQGFSARSAVMDAPFMRRTGRGLGGDADGDAARRRQETGDAEPLRFAKASSNSWLQRPRSPGRAQRTADLWALSAVRVQGCGCPDMRALTGRALANDATT